MEAHLMFFFHQNFHQWHILYNKHGQDLKVTFRINSPDYSIFHGYLKARRMFRKAVLKVSSKTYCKNNIVSSTKLTVLSQPTEHRMSWKVLNMAVRKVLKKQTKESN